MRIPAEYAKIKAQKVVLWLLLYVFVVETVFVAYDVHAGHEWLSHVGLIVLLSALPFKPWLSLSSNTWVYAVNDRGIYLRDTSDVINSIGFNVIRWDQCGFLNFQLGDWHGCPSLNIEFLHRGRRSKKSFVFRPEEEGRIKEELMPYFLTKLPKATTDATLVG